MSGTNKTIAKVIQTIATFKKITYPLESSLDLSFLYMIVFDEGSYYILVDNSQFINDFVQNVKKSSIFCAENITSFNNHDYNFTLWPQNPLSQAMEVCFNHNLWNGITVSQTHKGFAELWCFMGNKMTNRAQSFFTRNKDLLIKFIHYFNYHKSQFLIPEITTKQDLFKFTEGFDFSINTDEQDYEQQKIDRFLSMIKQRAVVINTKSGQVKLSSREIEVLALLSSGLTAKLAASKMNIAFDTVRHHIENIKLKTHLHQRINLIDFYLDHLKEIIE